MEFDPTEELLAQSVHSMDEHDLLIYCQESAKRVHGAPMSIDGRREVAQLAWFRRVYGADAGPMLKKIFNDYDGRLAGRPFSLAILARKNRALLDDVYFDIHKMEP